MRQLLAAILLAMLAVTSGCGYHTGGQAVRLPSELHTLYVPAFSNATQSYRIEQTVTADVIRELRSRTNYRIVTNNNDGEADATLTGVITQAFVVPLTYDSQTGRVSSSLVVVGMKASLTGKKGVALWDNPNYIFREQYEVSNELSSFFEEKNPAFERVATDFSRALVSNILEAY